ncbi:hypothetical protein EZJ49_04725 [Bdellovibrio bacteriovorus]|uniref:hypothetical protein n=1 Tax=Bdellovibrio bacteriovorus TaxID=959 RepID=UPI0021CE12BC|nr:hypothetical protein [Bdellovibrio bacteriovorus]UXR65555.1 hypothetical protein EZJ49_04725 [Bdellovibrio bacteriovorus]
MKFLAAIISLTLSCPLAQAQSGKIYLQGKVREKVDVTAVNGKLQIAKNSPRLKVVVDKRSPASVVRVEAP